MCTSESRGTEVAVGVGIVKRKGTGVLVLSSRPVRIATARVLEPGQGICNLVAHSAQPSTRVLYALGEIQLQPVVYRPSYGLEERQGWRAGIDSRESAAITAQASYGRKRANCPKISR